MNKAASVLSKNPLSAFASPWVRGLSVLGLAAGVWALSAGASLARAGDVVWSVGVHAPGLQLGVSNAQPPRVVQRPGPRPHPRPHPRPIVVQPSPVVVYPGYRYERPPVVVPQPVYVVRDGPRVVYIEEDDWFEPGGRRNDRHWRGGERRGDRHGRGDRHDRHHRGDRDERDGPRGRRD